MELVARIKKNEIIDGYTITEEIDEFLTTDITTFKKCVFDCSILNSNGRVYKSLIFENVTFNRNIHLENISAESLFFNECYFKGRSTYKFTNCKIKEIIITNSKIDGPFYFNNFTEGSINFAENTFLIYGEYSYLLKFENCFCQNSNFIIKSLKDNDYIKNIEFVDCLSRFTIEDINPIYFHGKLDFYNTNINNFYFYDTSSELLNLDNVKWHLSHDKLKIDSLFTFTKNNKINYRLFEVLYRKFKTQYLNLKDYYTADIFLLNEYRMKIKQKKWYQFFCWERFYHWTSNFGMSWRRPFLWIISIIIVCSLISLISIQINPEIFYKVALHLNSGELKEYNSYFDLRYYSVLNRFLLALHYHVANVLYIPQKEVMSKDFWTLFISRAENIFATTLLILSGFAVKRKFRM
jgi:uncharacterized protein YjbI with pentapeptide repeats